MAYVSFSISFSSFLAFQFCDDEAVTGQHYRHMNWPVGAGGMFGQTTATRLRLLQNLSSCHDHGVSVNQVQVLRAQNGISFARKYD